MQLYSMLCGSLDGRGVWGIMDTCTCVGESLCCSPEAITTLLISYTPLEDKEFKKIFFKLTQDVIANQNSPVSTNELSLQLNTF